MTKDLELKVGGQYRTLLGRCMVLQKFDDGSGFFVWHEDDLECFSHAPDGVVEEGCMSLNIIEEWKEPKTWEVYIDVDRDCEFHLFRERPNYDGRLQAIARRKVTLVEGEFDDQ